MYCDMEGIKLKANHVEEEQVKNFAFKYERCL